MSLKNILVNVLQVCDFMLQECNKWFYYLKNQQPPIFYVVIRFSNANFVFPGVPSLQTCNILGSRLNSILCQNSKNLPKFQHFSKITYNYEIRHIFCILHHTMLETGPKDKIESLLSYGIKELIQNTERYYIIQILNSVHWQINKAAQVMQISRSTLFRKMKKYNIAKTIFKPEKRRWWFAKIYSWGLFSCAWEHWVVNFYF